MAAITLEVAKTLRNVVGSGKRGSNKPIIHNRRKVLYKGKFGRNPQTDRILE